MPDRLITSGEGAPFVASVIEPFTVPVAEGLKVALNVVVAPAAIVVDVVNPVWPKPVPATLTWEKDKV